MRAHLGPVRRARYSAELWPAAAGAAANRNVAELAGTASRRGGRDDHQTLRCGGHRTGAGHLLGGRAHGDRAEVDHLSWFWPAFLDFRPQRGGIVAGAVLGGDGQTEPGAGQFAAAHAPGTLGVLFADVAGVATEPTSKPPQPAPAQRFASTLTRLLEHSQQTSPDLNPHRRRLVDHLPPRHPTPPHHPTPRLPHHRN
jgi:hypothetical protein